MEKFSGNKPPRKELEQKKVIREEAPEIKHVPELNPVKKDNDLVDWLVQWRKMERFEFSIGIKTLLFGRRIFR